jgi:T-complex protein 1 subunit zeta
VIVNEKGIDPLSLDELAKEGIIALRRAKKRNMQRLSLSTGGVEVTTIEELEPSVLGWAGKVYEHVLGEEKYTFVEDVRHPRSCSILIKAANDYGIAQIKEATRDGLRAIKNIMDDGCVIKGAGAFEVACAERLLERAHLAEGKARIGAEAFAAALLNMTGILATNAGFDGQEAVIALRKAHAEGLPAGLDINTGEPMDCDVSGVYDSYIVKKQILNSAPVMTSQLLLVDEVIRAGINMRKR